MVCCMEDEEVDLRLGRATSFRFGSSETVEASDAFPDTSGYVRL